MGFPCATRHVLVDTLGLVLHVLVTAADVQDRDGGILLLFSLFGQFPFLRKLFADSARSGPIFQSGISSAMPDLAIEIVRRSDHAKGFVVELMRWISSVPLVGSGLKRAVSVGG